MERAKEQDYNTNCIQLEEMYEGYFTLRKINHTDIVFDQYIQEYGKDICPKGGDISYEGRRVKCRLHNKEDESNDDG